MTVRADPETRADRSASGAVMLGRTLRVDGATSGVVGLLMLAAAPGLTDLWGLPTLLLRTAGVAMVLWGVGLIELCRRETIPSAAVRGVIVANWSWFAASVLLLLNDWVEPTEFGFAFVAGQSAIVAVFAIRAGFYGSVGSAEPRQVPENRRPFTGRPNQDGAITIPPTSYRFYDDLARWWPLISPPDEYTEEAEVSVSLLQRAALPVGEVLELGSGGGHNAVHLKEHFAMTLVDLSEAMLDVSRRLNPECVHRQGDMRSIRLGRQFDAVFIHDAIDYMTDEADLRMAMETAFVHCHPGGLALFMPDDIRETFKEGTDHGGDDAADGSGVRYLEWDWDPDPGDTWKLTEYAFLLREVDGSIQSVHETHRTGLFSADVWVRLLSEVGFEPETVTEVTTEDRAPRELFIGRRPQS